MTVIVQSPFLRLQYDPLSGAWSVAPEKEDFHRAPGRADRDCVPRRAEKNPMDPDRLDVRG